MIKKCGIYQIKNIINGKIYVGSSINIYHRWGQHKGAFRSNRHHNSHFQSSWNKYGEKNFEFTIVEECSVEELTKKEEETINKFTPEYNKTLIVRERQVCSVETRKKLSLANTGKKLSEEHKDKLRGRIFTEEHKNKMSESGKIKIFTKKHRENMSEARKHVIVSEETKRKISDSQKGKMIPEEVAKKISEAYFKKLESLGKEIFINYNAKLNWKLVREIRELYKDGVSYKLLMEKFAMKQTAIYSIINNKSWKE